MRQATIITLALMYALSMLGFAMWLGLASRAALDTCMETYSRDTCFHNLMR